jgi:hypothetical protein
MGQELVCTARWRGKSVRGKAMLETGEIIFRGEERLKIPFSAIRLVASKGGELHVKTGDELVIFELGGQAAVWREKIANPKSVIEKLGVRKGDLVTFFGNLDAEFSKKLQGQKSAIMQDKITADVKWIFFAVETREELSQVKKIAGKMKGSATLWVVYPKGQRRITETDVIGAGREAGLKDVKVVGFSATHTALKFVIPVEKR